MKNDADFLFCYTIFIQIVYNCIYCRKVHSVIIINFQLRNTSEFLLRFWKLLARLNVYRQQITARYDFYEILQLEREHSVEKTEELRT